MEPLKDRTQAGKLLANALAAYAGERDLIILALPRGGVPVAFEIAKALSAPLDVFLVRKLGVPGHEELALGAVTNGGTRVLNQSIVDGIGIPPAVIDSIAAREIAEIKRREAVYREGLGPLALEGKTVILVDDGLATGATMLAAIRAIRECHPRKLVAAVPVAPAPVCDVMGREADEMLCLHTPEPFYGVGQWYDDFTQTSDAEVVALLKQASSVRGRDVRLPCGDVELRGTLSLPEGEPRGIVLFVHGSGSGRKSPRNQYVASALVREGFATLLFDLLTTQEEVIDARTRQLRFDIPVLAHRLELVTAWVIGHPRLGELPIGYFGASTGAAAALVAAAIFGDGVRAVVSRGGRPDLAGEALVGVTAPTLLIVGGRDSDVLVLNREAMAKMRAGLAHLAVVPEATHLFEETGALDQVIDLAAEWFVRHLEAAGSTPTSASA